jgi:pyrimidine deaminase RibD-like protein
MPAAGQSAAEVASYESAYESCATLAASRYSSGTDAADLIATVAMESCQSQRRAYAQSLQRAGGAANVVLSMVDQFDAAMMRKLKLLILEARIKK